MTQDTRKDRRVKIVSLNVRYKSATVDEFIENHAHDVSRGGIYIKTATPFPQGTLLKFEIRLASDQTVITGVGRVVWKREGAAGDQPAGMGVKFIKVDDSSKVVIDRLVTTKSDAGKSFEAEADPTAAPRPGASSHAPGPPSVAPPSSKRDVGPYKIGSAASPGGAGPSSRPVSPPSTAPRPVAPSPLFPKPSAPPAEGPKQEQTVMKQAAELLEEALREAGGSMEEVGTNPLFSPNEAEASAALNEPKAQPSLGPPTTGLQARVSGGPPKADEGKTARGMVAALSPGHATATKAGETPRAAATSVAPAAKKKSSNVGLTIGAAVAVAIVVVSFNRDRLFGHPEEIPSPMAAPAPPLPPPPPTPATVAPPITSPTAAEAPGPDASVQPAPSASASSAPASKPSASAASSNARAPAPPPPKPASAPAIAVAPPAPTPTAEATSAPAAATSTATAAASSAPAPKPVVRPRPPPAPKPNTDNPY
jgi:uncharacterized protein (TIGR02266 family)